MSKIQNKPFKMAGKEISPGQRLQFDIPAAALYTHTPLDLTVEIIHGKQPGPVLLICAGIHGDELNGIEIIRRLRTLKTLKSLKGTLVLVPVVNLHGFIHQSRYLPDRRDLNRCFPGSESGSLGSRIAHLFFTEVVARCTHVIDLHTAAIHRDNLPQIRAALDNPEVKKMALDFSIPVIINAGLIEGTLRAEAGERGIPVLTYEAGEALRLSEGSIVTGIRGITNAMRGLSMLPARRNRAAVTEPNIARSSKWFRASGDGMFRPLVKLGDRVNADDLLGIISSPFSSAEVGVSSTVDGIVIGMNNLPLVYEGEALFHIALFGEASVVQEDITTHASVIATDPLFEIEQVASGQIEDIDLK